MDKYQAVLIFEDEEVNLGTVGEITRRGGWEFFLEEGVNQSIHSLISFIVRHLVSTKQDVGIRDRYEEILTIQLRKPSGD